MATVLLIANTSGERDEVYRFETVPLVFATPMLAPSKATCCGAMPTVNSAVWFAAYQRRMATWLGLAGCA